MQTSLENPNYEPPTSSAPSSSPVWDGIERRKGTSTLDHGSATLSHALRYLIAEQFAGRCSSAKASREAIAILSRARVLLDVSERREPARSKIESKLRNFLG